MIVLTLPLPPSPNRQPRSREAAHAAKRRYQRQAWQAAVKQHRPLRDPCELVVVDAYLAVVNVRDHDNMHGSLKWALDALRQAQKSRKWRNGLSDLCGYFVDDDPKHLTIRSVSQSIDRDDPRLELSITEVL